MLQLQDTTTLVQHTIQMDSAIGATIAFRQADGIRQADVIAVKEYNGKSAPKGLIYTVLVNGLPICVNEDDVISFVWAVR